ncbi:MAG: DUF6057 family protein [Planctomycetota bacterium]
MKSSHELNGHSIRSWRGCWSTCLKNLAMLISKFCRPAAGSVFFVLFYLYIWLEIEPCLLYHGGGWFNRFPVFFTDWWFFRKFLSYPGGLLEYLCSFLSQFFYCSWAGGLVVTLQAWLIYLCTNYYIKAIGAYRLRFIRFIGPLFLLAAYSQYIYLFPTTMAFLAALIFSCVYLKTTSKSKMSGPIYFLIFSIILYVAAGGAYLLFGVLCVIYEFFFRGRHRTGFLYLVLAAGIPYLIGALIFGQRLFDAFTELLPVPWKSIGYEASPKKMIGEMLYGLYLSLPLIGLVVGLWRVLTGRGTLSSQKAAESSSQSSRGEKKPNVKSAKPDSSYPGSAIAKWRIGSIALFLFTGAVISFWHNSQNKCLLAVVYYDWQKKWPQVLAAARRYRYGNSLTQRSCFITHSVNHALYHTGRLGYEMFSYPQHLPALFMTIPERTQSETILWKIVDSHIDLGLINVAENAMTEAIQLSKHPLLFKRLALISMAKANYGAARVYLGALSRTLFYSHWANKYLDLLETDPNRLSEDEDIRGLRRIMLRNEFAYSEVKYEKLLLQLLAENRQNQMAFEYLMALYLMSRHLDKFSENLYRLKDFGYTQIPRHYEEAILLYRAMIGKQVVLHGFSISADSINRFKEFSRDYRLYKQYRQAVYGRLAEKHGDSYYFYYFYNRSGMKK